MRKLARGGAMAASAPAPASLSPTSSGNEREKYEHNLQGLRVIGLVTNITLICSWFLSFCALTWASAVLLGAYIQQLTMWDYYDVSLLLFVEGLRIGIAALLRYLGYRLWDSCRWALASIAFYLPLGMGGFAVLSILPPQIRHSIYERFAGHKSSSLLLHRHEVLVGVMTISRKVDSATLQKYSSLSASLKIFYILILLNTLVLLLGTSITGLMRRHYIQYGIKSLCKFHDKMMESPNYWLHHAVDLSFAFEIQGRQYEKERDAKYVCEKYPDLIFYLYLAHEKGVQAAEVALASDNVYVREAAANIVGFWAVLESIPGKIPADDKHIPLCFQRTMLCKLADIASESYGTMGTAAARSFSLLLQAVRLEFVGMVARLHCKDARGDLIDILLKRAAELLHPPCPAACSLPPIIEKESHAHLCALRQYLHRITEGEGRDSGLDQNMKDFLKAQQRQLVKKMKKLRIEVSMNRKANRSSTATEGSNQNLILIQDLDARLSEFLEEQISKDQYEVDTTQIDNDEHGVPIKQYCSKYYADIERLLQNPSPPAPSLTRAIFLLVFNVPVPIVCLGAGFIVNALL